MFLIFATGNILPQISEHICTIDGGYSFSVNHESKLNVSALYFRQIILY